MHCVYYHALHTTTHHVTIVMCNVYGTSMLDKRTIRNIQGLRVRCSKDGCDWEGELRDLERHLCNLCLYVEEVCPLGCGQSYPHHLLQTHQLDECPQ